MRVVLPPLGHPTTSTAQPQLPGRMFGLVLYQPITNGLVMLISLCLAKYLRTRTVLFLPHLTVSIFSHTEYLQVVIIRIKGESDCKTITQSMSLGRHLPCVGHPPPLACHRPIHEADVTHWANPGPLVLSCLSSMLDTSGKRNPGTLQCFLIIAKDLRLINPGKGSSGPPQLSWAEPAQHTLAPCSQKPQEEASLNLLIGTESLGQQEPCWPFTRAYCTNVIFPGN